MKYLSVYSGIGMHDCGFEAAGWRCAGQIEWDDFCTAVLEKHWPGLPRWKDVRDATVDDVRARCGRIDCVTGGFACQDVSTAGKGAGLGRQTRSGITWRNLFRLIRGLQPEWAVIENVPALRVRGADRVLPVMEAIGYAGWPLVVGAAHAGLPIKRQRVWIVCRRMVARTDGVGLEGWRPRESDTIQNRPAAGTVFQSRPPGPRQVDRIPLGFDGASERLARRYHAPAIKAQGNGNPPPNAYAVAEAINRLRQILEFN